jgi:hypothetical protein
MVGHHTNPGNLLGVGKIDLFHLNQKSRPNQNAKSKKQIVRITFFRYRSTSGVVVLNETEIIIETTRPVAMVAPIIIIISPMSISFLL